jgi:hypothetical protein
MNFNPASVGCVPRTRRISVFQPPELKNMTIQALGNTGLKDLRAYVPKNLPLKYSQLKKPWISETEYWEKYYDHPEKVYEWHNGYLEEKTMSEQVTYLTYLWYLKLIDFYLETNHKADLCGLEMGFRLVLPDEVDIRKPDLGIVLKNNPVPLLLHDSSYDGIFDLCVEAISQSSAKEIIRDTVIKKAEYARAGVKEYVILDGNKRYTEFYRLNKHGVYVPIKPLTGGLIKSNVLPGFQFRIDDLYQKPSPDEMINDPIYQKFVLPGYSEEKHARIEAEQRAEAEAQRAETEAQRAKQALQRAEAEAQRTKQALKRVDKERQRAEKEQQQKEQALERAARLAQILREQGIDPDKLT